MAKYVVVITPKASAFDSADELAQATIWVDTEPPAPRITEMTIRSTTPGGLFAPGSQGIDFAGVILALNAAVREAESVAATQATPDDSPVVSGTTTSPGQASLQTGATSSEETPAGDSAVLPPAPVTIAEKGERVYRRMPDVGEVRAAYERIGSVTGLAKHYDVPRHTAQGWMTRIRKIAE